MSQYSLSPEAAQDLYEIWQFIATDNEDAANRIEWELYETFGRLAKMPRMGRSRPELTLRPVLFFPVRSYLIMYEVKDRAIKIHAILHGRRNLKRMLKERATLNQV